jgi:hypothetical protein
MYSCSISNSKYFKRRGPQKYIMALKSHKIKHGDLHIYMTLSLSLSLSPILMLNKVLWVNNKMLCFYCQ